MRLATIIALLFVLAPLEPAFAQLAGTGNFHIVWEVKSRFRLFRREADFARMVAASRGDGVFAAERRLEKASGGQGWAKDVVAHLCVDDYGNVLATCRRDGVMEDYLVPRNHLISVSLSGPVPKDATCAWSFDDGSGPLDQIRAPCGMNVRLRVPYGPKTVVTVDVPLGDGTAQRVVTEIAVRDLLIAGLGDSIAAGEGDPDQAVQLGGSFCFRRFGGGEYYRPGRAGFTGDRTCENGPATPGAALDWARHGARWMSPACHRSLYSYQVRAALALAIEQPHIAVTFLPLACTGATIEAGMFHRQRADDCPSVVGIYACPSTSPAQFDELSKLMAQAHRQDPGRRLDMVLLTIGANDVHFAALVANVIVNSSAERIVLEHSGGIVTLAAAQRALEHRLPREFARLRTALKPLVGGDLSRVVFVSYGNPAMQSPQTPCPGGRDGLDIHPAFSADANRLRATAAFVNDKFLPELKALATCDGPDTCHDPMTDRMTFVDAHQAAFEHHGMCVHTPGDPTFDRRCFSRSGKSFVSDLVAAAQDPMACSLPASDYLPYTPRGRWVRTADDSYFTAMTYPEAMPADLKPTDIHDALWGVLSAVYGGAVHPTAQGYAAMADAALPAARQVLGLPAPPAVIEAPLPPPAADAPGAPAAVPATPASLSASAPSMTSSPARAPASPPARVPARAPASVAPPGSPTAASLPPTKASPAPLTLTPESGATETAPVPPARIPSSPAPATAATDGQ